MSDETESLDDQGAAQEVADMERKTAPTPPPAGAPARIDRDGVVALANAARAQVPPLAGEDFPTYAARVQAHFKTERPPSALRSIAEAARLNEISAKDPKYTRARYDADLAVTDVANLPERLHPKKGQAGNVEIVIALVMLAIVVAILAAVEVATSYSCHSKAAKMGLPGNYGVIDGCMIQVKGELDPPGIIPDPGRLKP